VKKAITEAYQGHNSRLRTSAIYAMGRNCDHSWLPVLLKELGSADPEMRYEAATACGELGEEKAALYLTGLLNDPDIDVRVAVIQALGKIGGAEAKECLELCLSSPNEAIHQAAEQSLHELEAGEAPFAFRGLNS
jgi:HEAT repeat protein